VLFKTQPTPSDHLSICLFIWPLELIYSSQTKSKQIKGQEPKANTDCHIGE